LTYGTGKLSSGAACSPQMEEDPKSASWFCLGRWFLTPSALLGEKGVETMQTNAAK